ncbi:hypothetical protein BDR07DRAFT_1430982 [Suillus spraguei]|nr:hypothetical protein BDR07DRAFT_1430982 [Suillus spraguei]
MSILTIPKLANELFLRPITISMNNLALSALMPYVMSANGSIDWRPMTICVTSDILAMSADHLKDEEEFSPDCNNGNNPRLASWFTYARTFLTASTVFLALALSQCQIPTLLTTTAFVAPALLWATPICFKSFGLISRRLFKRLGRDKHQPCTSAPVLVFRRIPGMKAIFNGIIRGWVLLFRCGICTMVLSMLSRSGDLTKTLPSPWSVQLIVWSIINRSCRAIMTGVRDFEENMKASVPTIPVLLGSILKTKALLAACHMLVSSKTNTLREAVYLLHLWYGYLANTRRRRSCLALIRSPCLLSGIC